MLIFLAVTGESELHISLRTDRDDWKYTYLINLLFIYYSDFGYKY